MSRLVAFGCSFTYGDELPGCVSGTNNPSKHAWPQIAADILGLECVNQGISSIGNKHILHEIMTFDFQESDIVIVMWSFFNRHCVITDDNKAVDLTHWSIDSDNPHFSSQGSWIDRANYAYYADPGLQTIVDGIFNNVIYIQHADIYLKNLGVRYIHTSVPGHEQSRCNTLSDISSRRRWYGIFNEDVDAEFSKTCFRLCNHWNNISPSLVFKGSQRLGQMPNGHPSAEAHRFFANRLVDLIQRKAHD
jgi:hypothetical protein